MAAGKLALDYIKGRKTLVQQLVERNKAVAYDRSNEFACVITFIDLSRHHQVDPNKAFQSFLRVYVLIKFQHNLFGFVLTLLARLGPYIFEKLFCLISDRVVILYVNKFLLD